jgi:hypothetical protein
VVAVFLQIAVRLAGIAGLLALYAALFHLWWR